MDATSELEQLRALFEQPVGAGAGRSRTTVRERLYQLATQLAAKEPLLMKEINSLRTKQSRVEKMHAAAMLSRGHQSELQLLAPGGVITVPRWLTMEDASEALAEAPGREEFLSVLRLMQLPKSPLQPRA